MDIRFDDHNYSGNHRLVSTDEDVSPQKDFSSSSCENSCTDSENMSSSIQVQSEMKLATPVTYFQDEPIYPIGNLRNMEPNILFPLDNNGQHTGDEDLVETDSICAVDFEPKTTAMCRRNLQEYFVYKIAVKDISKLYMIEPIDPVHRIREICLEHVSRIGENMKKGIRDFVVSALLDDVIYREWIVFCDGVDPVYEKALEFFADRNHYLQIFTGMRRVCALQDVIRLLGKETPDYRVEIEIFRSPSTPMLILEYAAKTNDNIPGSGPEVLNYGDEVRNSRKIFLMVIEEYYNANLREDQNNPGRPVMDDDGEPYPAPISYTHHLDRSEEDYVERYRSLYNKRNSKLAQEFKRRVTLLASSEKQASIMRTQPEENIKSSDYWASNLGYLSAFNFVSPDEIDVFYEFIKNSVYGLFTLDVADRIPQGILQSELFALCGKSASVQNSQRISEGILRMHWSNKYKSRRFWERRAYFRFHHRQNPTEQYYQTWKRNVIQNQMNLKAFMTVHCPVSDELTILKRDEILQADYFNIRHFGKKSAAEVPTESTTKPDNQPSSDGSSRQLRPKKPEVKAVSDEDGSRLVGPRKKSKTSPRTTAALRQKEVRKEIPLIDLTKLEDLPEEVPYENINRTLFKFEYVDGQMVIRFENVGDSALFLSWIRAGLSMAEKVSLETMITPDLRRRGVSLIEMGRYATGSEAIEECILHQKPVPAEYWVENEVPTGEGSKKRKRKISSAKHPGKEGQRHAQTDPEDDYDINTIDNDEEQVVNRDCQLRNSKTTKTGGRSRKANKNVI